MAQNIVPLTDRGLVTVRGPDAPKFLQDLVTADIAGLEVNSAAFAGLLTPQGKILFDFFVIREAQGYLIDVLLEQREALMKRLMLYKLRAKLEIAADSERGVVALFDSQVAGAIPDPRSPAMGFRSYATASSTNGSPAPYHRRRIAMGLAEMGHDFDAGELFPHEANFDKIGAVNFQKGCFVGQEVVSRIEHRGTARSRIVPMKVEGDLPKKGTEISAAGRGIGTACSGIDDRLLALVRLDRLEEARNSNMPILAGSSRVRPEPAVWAGSVPIAS